MPKIQFDVLTPHDQAERVREVFSTACQKLQASGDITTAAVLLDDAPSIPADIEAQLRQTYRDEHEDKDLENAAVYRYLITVGGVSGSVNQLAMVLSRLLTPHAVLPKDHVLLEDERAHERPAIYPWTLEVFR